MSSKTKPDVSDFIAGGVAAQAEGQAQAANKITKTIRLSKVMDTRLKTVAHERSMSSGKRVTESDLIEQALHKYLK